MVGDGERAYDTALGHSAAMPIKPPSRWPWTDRLPSSSQMRRSGSASRAEQASSRRAGRRRRYSSPSSGVRRQPQSQAQPQDPTQIRPSRPSYGTSLQPSRPAAATGQNSSVDARKAKLLNKPFSMARPRFPIGLQGFDMIARATSADSMSSASAGIPLSQGTTMTSKPPGSGDAAAARRLFTLRNGRMYFHDATLPYPLPFDLAEIHRQHLHTLLTQVFVRRMMCYRYFKAHSHTDISFTGIDIAPILPATPNTSYDAKPPDQDMRWNFVQHDLRQLPWPLPTENFDLVVTKDMSLALPCHQHQSIYEEYLRLVRPGGYLEIWEADHPVRILRPHVPRPAQHVDVEEQEAATKLGAYTITASTPLSAPLNNFLIDYNQWLMRALEARDLAASPCTLITPALLQESDTLEDIRSRRLAIPLNEIRWEREGLDAVLTSAGGQDLVNTQDRDVERAERKRKPITSSQATLRKAALLTVVQKVQALESMLRETSGKSQDEWDIWVGKMTSELMGEDGAGWGECLEVGAWWGRKKQQPQ